jgi:hypothetical protein
MTTRAFEAGWEAAASALDEWGYHRYATALRERARERAAVTPIAIAEGQEVTARGIVKMVADASGRDALVTFRWAHGEASNAWVRHEDIEPEGGSR